ncbi:MAG: uracil phosphoribosyltransferase [bacterium]|nr:uracil phosphoribosyltransferase [bacterium]
MAIKIIDHPLIQHKLTNMRDKNTGSKDFRELVDEVSNLLAYEATREMETIPVEVETPLNMFAKGRILAGKMPAIIPILRAGLGMVDGILRLIPMAKVGHLGIYRDHETLQPVVYYNKMPKDIQERDVFIVDPMFATGGSLIAACDLIKELRPKSLKAMCIIASPEALSAFEKTHPEVTVYTAAVDERLNEKGYILPGLGDAGDRLFGTK